MKIEIKTQVWDHPQMREKFLKINRSILIAWGFMSMIAAWSKNYEVLIVFWIIVLIYQIVMERSYIKWQNSTKAK